MAASLRNCEEGGGNWRSTWTPTEGDERHVAEVVATRRAAALVELVPDGGQGRLGQRIVEAVGLRGVLEEAVGIGRAQDGAEVAVARGVGLGEPAHEGAVLGRVVADGEGVVGGVREEAVHLAVVVLQATARVGVVGVGEAAAVELGLMVGGLAVPCGLAYDRPACLPSAWGSQPRKWSKLRFSIITTITCSMPDFAGAGGARCWPWPARRRRRALGPGLGRTGLPHPARSTAPDAPRAPFTNVRRSTAT